MEVDRQTQMIRPQTEKDNFTEVNRVLRILTKPFEYQDEAESSGFADPPPSWSEQLKVSCSS
jgi:uncharacterized protein YdiU (UPF0061 family)